MTESEQKLRKWLLCFNYLIATVVFVLIVLTEEGFSIVDWLGCFILIVLVPLFSTYIQMTQIGLFQKLWGMVRRR